MRSSCVAIIPARGGSKGIPRKNARDLGGLPLVARTIRCALAAARVDRVVVSTDDAEVASIARHFGAEVIERPAEISGDRASSESALTHALGVLAERGEEPELVMFLQCTSPLTRSEDLDGCVATLEARSADSAFTASPFVHFVWEEGDDGAARGVNHDGGPRKRRQDLAPQYVENGAVYVMRRARFLEEGTRFCGRTVLHAVDAARTLEIDEPMELAMAEAAVRHLERVDRAAALPERPSAVVLDFDGVLTDNAVYVSQDGSEAVRCDRGDGMGLERLRAAGVPVLVLSKERNPVVTARVEKLRLPCLQGIDDKLPALRAWLDDNGLAVADAIFVGNDVNDVDCLRAVGCAVCPADAHPLARAASRVVLTRPGGRGAVRELCELVLERLGTPLE